MLYYYRYWHTVRLVCLWLACDTALFFSSPKQKERRGSPDRRLACGDKRKVNFFSRITTKTIAFFPTMCNVESNLDEEDWELGLIWLQSRQGVEQGVSRETSSST